MNAFMIGGIVGGFIAIYLVSSLLDWIVVKRVIANPVGRIWGSVGSAYIFGIAVSALGEGFFGKLGASLIIYGVAAILVVLAKYFTRTKAEAIA